MPVYACCLGDDCNRFNHSKGIEITQFWIKKVAYEKSHLSNGIQIHLSMEEENRTRQKKDYSIILHRLVKGLHKEFSEKDSELLKNWWMSSEASDSGSWGLKRRKKNLMCWWKCCIMYVWYHFVLLIWIDMILAKCFLNNWIIYYCLCYLSVSQTWTKKLNSPLFSFILFLKKCYFWGLSMGQRPFAL